MSPFITFLMSHAATTRQISQIVNIIALISSAWILVIAALYLGRITPTLWIAPRIVIGLATIPFYKFNLYIIWWQTITAYSLMVMHLFFCVAVVYASLLISRSQH